MVRIAHGLLLKGCHDVHAAERRRTGKGYKSVIIHWELFRKVELQSLN
jgi:hypothetical protein